MPPNKNSGTQVSNRSLENHKKVDIYLAYVQADNNGVVLALRQQELGGVQELQERAEAPWQAGLG